MIESFNALGFNIKGLLYFPSFRFKEIDFGYGGVINEGIGIGLAWSEIK